MKIRLVLVSVGGDNIKGTSMPFKPFLGATALAVFLTTSTHAQTLSTVQLQPLLGGVTIAPITSIHPLVVKNPNLKCQAPDLQVIKSGKAVFSTSISASAPNFNQDFCEDKTFVTNLLLTNLANPANTIEFCGVDQLHQFTSQSCKETLNTDDYGRPVSKSVQIPTNWECYRCDSVNKDDCIHLDVSRYQNQEINGTLRKGTIQTDTATKTIHSKVDDYNGGQWIISDDMLNQLKTWLTKDRGITLKVTLESKAKYTGVYQDPSGNPTGGGPNAIAGTAMKINDTLQGSNFGFTMFISAWNNGIDQFQRHLCFARTRSNFIDVNGWLNYGVRPKNASEDFLCHDLGRDILADQQYEANVTIVEGSASHFVAAFQGSTYDEQDYFSGRLIFPDRSSSDLVGGKFGMVNVQGTTPYQMGSMLSSIRSGRASAVYLPSLFHVEGEANFIDPRVCPYIADPVATITDHVNGAILKGSQEAFEFRFIGTAKDKKASCDLALSYLGKDGLAPPVAIDKKTFASVDSDRFYNVPAMATQASGYYRAQLTCVTSIEKKKIIAPLILLKK